MTAAKAGARAVLASTWSSWTAKHLDKEASWRGDIAADRHENVDHLAVLLDRPVHVGATHQRFSHTSRRRTSRHRLCVDFGQRPRRPEG